MDKNAFLNDLSQLVKRNDNSAGALAGNSEFPSNIVHSRIDEQILTDGKLPSHTLRKPEFNQNRKGMPQKYSPSHIIVDEEYLLTQTP